MVLRHAWLEDIGLIPILLAVVHGGVGDPHKRPPRQAQLAVAERQVMPHRHPDLADAHRRDHPQRLLIRHRTLPHQQHTVDLHSGLEWIANRWSSCTYFNLILLGKLS